MTIDLTESKEKNSFKKLEKNSFKKIEKDKNTSRKNIISDIDNKELKENKEKENEEEKKEKRHRVNMGDNYITIQSIAYHDNRSIIEAKLPNPYLDINRPERNKTIEYRIKSKFKSPYADYINHSLTNDGTNSTNKNRLKYINYNKYNNNIHFKGQNLMKNEFQ